MIRSDIIRGYNDYIILAVLMEGPSYGYAISKAIRKRTEDTYVMKETTLYSALNRLQAKGFVLPVKGSVTTKGSKRTYFRITPEGEVYLKEIIDEWKAAQAVINAFLPKEEE